MFKVSFNDSSRKVFKEGRETTVILRGTVKLPEFWHSLPQSIMDWIANRKNLEVYENLVNNYLIIYSSGISRCHKDDKYDSILGERVAEGRAKLYIYRFFCTLCMKIERYYNKILFGTPIVDSGDGDCLMADIKKYTDFCIREAHHLGELLKDKE